MSLSKEEILNLIKPIKIAKITEAKKNENSDHLQVTQINAGDVTAQVVTGASNFKEGDLVPYLAPGFAVPGFIFSRNETIVLEKRKLRGYESEGMLLAEDEIGLGENHEGLMILNLGDDSIGKSILDILSEDQLNTVFKNAGYVEVTPEIQAKLDLITGDLAETIGVEDLAPILAERSVKIYWGTAPTGRPHLGYFVPMMKIADFLEAGCEVTVLLADIHAYLDNMKSSWELLEYRVQYYEFIIKEILNLVGVPIEKLKFIKGSTYQLNKDYQLDLLKISAMASLRDVQKAGAEVVKQVESPLMSSMLYPILQALDEQYLEADAQFGGVDQRKIFMFAREYLPKIGYKKRVHLLNTLIPGLGKSGKMSSSEPNSKIDLDDSDETIKEKINKAFALDGEVEGNGLLAILKFILFRKFKSDNRTFVVEREEKWGGNVEYSNYKDIEEDYKMQKLVAADLKPAVARELISLITPLRSKIEGMADLIAKAYPAK